jgi:hypothetical protein
MKIQHLGIVDRVIRHSHDDYTTWKEGQYVISENGKSIKIFPYFVGYALIGGNSCKESAYKAALEFKNSRNRGNLL